MIDWNVAFLTYLFTLIPKTVGLAAFLCVFGAIASIISTIIFFVARGSDDENDMAAYFAGKCIMKVSWPVLVLSAAFLTFMPRQQDVALILGLSVGYEQTQKVVQSERMQRLGGKSLDAIEAWLDDVAEDNKEAQDED